MTEQNAEPARSRFSYGVPSLLVAVIAALVYAYVLWGAIGNLVNLPQLLTAVTPWWLLILDVVVPVAVYVLALTLGVRRRPAVRMLFFLAGTAVISAATVSSIAYIHTHFGIG